MLSAIIIRDRAGAGEDQELPSSFGSQGWAAVQVLGKSPIARIAEAFRKNGCDQVSVITNCSQDSEQTKFMADCGAELLASYRRNGSRNVVLACCDAYFEIDLAEMLSFHEKQSVGVTRAVTASGPLDVWIVDSSWIPERGSLLAALRRFRPARYASDGYINQLQSAQDFRRLVLDGLYSRCGFSPQGQEIRPGVWICEGAQIERSARIVPPAFVGRNVLISDDCLITRGSTVESDSHIDFGTAIEDSSILSNTYVGIGLDVAHSVIDGTDLLNLRHNVNLTISDPVVLRKNTAHGRNRKAWTDLENGELVLSSAAY